MNLQITSMSYPTYMLVTDGELGHMMQQSPEAQQNQRARGASYY